MRKLAFVLAATLALGGCAQLQNFFSTVTNPITADNLVQAELAYGAVLAVAVGYRTSCVARTIPPSCRTVVPKLQAADQKVQGALVAAKNFIKNNPTISPATSISAVELAIADFQAVQATYGVK